MVYGFLIGNLQLEEPETYAPPCIHTITGIGAKGFVSGAATLRKRQSSETGVPSGEFPMDMHRLPKVVPLRVAFGYTTNVTMYFIKNQLDLK